MCMYEHSALIKPKINVFQNKLFMNKISIFFKATSAFFYSSFQHFSHVLTSILFIFFFARTLRFVFTSFGWDLHENRAYNVCASSFNRADKFMKKQSKKAKEKKCRTETAIFRFCCVYVFILFHLMIFFSVWLDTGTSTTHDTFSHNPYRDYQSLWYTIFAHYYPFKNVD